MNLLLENVGTFVSHEIVPALVLKTYGAQNEAYKCG